MIYTDTGVVLFRSPFREADRMISLYTREHGRINVRLPGVCKTQGKLKALSEPFTHAQYRIYVKRGGAVGTVTGGKTESVFPHLRADLKRLTLAMHFCELFMRMTPLHQPSPEKYELLLKSLTELDLGTPNPAFASAFTLRLMRAAGFGLDHPVLKISPEFWRRMHEEELSSLVFSEPDDLLALSRCNSVCRRFLNQYLTYPLNTLKNFTLEPASFAQEETEAPLPAADFAPVPVH